MSVYKIIIMIRQERFLLFREYNKSINLIYQEYVLFGHN